MSLTPHVLLDLEKTEVSNIQRVFFFHDLVDHYKFTGYVEAVNCYTTLRIPHLNLADGSHCNFLFNNSVYSRGKCYISTFLLRNRV